MDPPSQANNTGAPISKRKRLAKACDACHKSKRRCDGVKPCSNCHYAHKSCSYTDSNGNAVPAPVQTDGGHKRPRISESAAQELDPTIPTPYDSSIPSPSPFQAIDYSISRDLTNLFFAHCHPVQSILHRPSFLAALVQGFVPPHLLYATCALGIRHWPGQKMLSGSQQLTSKDFAREARNLILNDSNSGESIFKIPNSVDVAQTLCLLLWLDEENSRDKENYRDLALQVTEDLGILPTSEGMSMTEPMRATSREDMDMECLRRVFWSIFVWDCWRCLFPPSTSRQTHPHGNFPSSSMLAPYGYSPVQMRIRLPVDESSFEMVKLHEAPFESIEGQGRVLCNSEIGHLVRSMMLYQRVLNSIDLFPTGQSFFTAAVSAVRAVNDTERLLDEWKSSLPPNLLLTSASVSTHRAMWATASNMSAWCFVAMHSFWVGSCLGLAFGRKLSARFVREDTGRGTSNVLPPTNPASPMTQVAIALSDRKEYIRTDISRKHAILFALIGEERAVRSGLLHVLIEPFIRFASVSPYTEVIASERALDSARVLDLATVNSPYMQDWFAHYHLASLNGMNSAEDLTQDLLRRCRKNAVFVDDRVLLENVRDPSAEVSVKGESSSRSLLGPLPSLKSSGLLDSHRPPSHQTPRSYSPPTMPYSRPLAMSHSKASWDLSGQGRSSGPEVPASAPVGLPWLGPSRSKQ